MRKPRPQKQLLPKPYHAEFGITVYNCDFREVMPSLEPQSLDLILTDPPYGLNYNDGDLASAREKVFGDGIAHAPRPIKGDGEEEAIDLLTIMLEYAKERLLKGGCCCCCCCGGGGPKPLFARWTLLMDQIIGFKQAVVWDKGGLGMGIHFRRSYEFLLVAQNGDPCAVWNGGKTTSNVWRQKKIIPQYYEHPTEKPIDLMMEVIGLFTHPDGLVFDPFMGSGTTVIAAKKLGRRAIGIDIDERWCEMAVNRLRQEVLFK